MLEAPTPIWVGRHGAGVDNSHRSRDVRYAGPQNVTAERRSALEATEKRTRRMTNMKTGKNP